VGDTAIDWTDVPGHPGYRVTSAGALRGPRSVLRPMVMPTGHQYVITGARRKLWVHHAVLLAFVGPRPVGQECRHLDGNPANNSLQNLRWGTRLENSHDKQRHGTELRGEAKPDARLTVAQVRAIRLDTRAARTVGREYGVSHTAVLRIRRGERWAAA
jgi:hypothetical protein